MAEHTLTIDDPEDLLPDDVRRCALTAAEAMLEHKGVTVEQCATIGTKLAKPVRPGTIPSFFGGMGEAAAAWLEACTVVQDLCGPEVRLRIVDQQAPLPH